MISGQEYNKPNTIMEFSLPENSTAHRILIFIKNALPEFEKEFNQSNLQIHLEDDISEQLCGFFNNKAIHKSFIFRFNAKVGVDFTIFVYPFQLGASSIFMIEAKRLSKANYDYVSNKNGGIERFKKEQNGFGKHLKTGAMIGYIQDETQEYWQKKINRWIEELIHKSTTVVWEEDDKLVSEKIYADFISKHSRVSGSSITLFHYWISLN